MKAFDDNITRTGTNVRFSNNAYRFSNLQNSTVAELNSRFAGGFSNKLILSYSAIRDSRDVVGAPGPAYQISEGGVTYSLGQERSSVANQLDQDIIEITDNLTKAIGKHTFTVGTHNEGFKFRNLFLNNGAGYYTFSSLANFQAGKATQVQSSYPTANNGEASFKAAQLGFYAQDEYTPVENLRLTLGMRIDVPVFVDKPGYNAGVTEGSKAANGTFNAGFGSQYKTSNTPNGQVLYSPRLGFNWDVNNDTKIQLRGGTGIFSGRVPFVWISNSYTNSGLVQGSVNQTAATGTTLPVQIDPAKIATSYTQVLTSQINLVSDNFKLPRYGAQTWQPTSACRVMLSPPWKESTPRPLTISIIRIST
nr:TonB-dependent receptor [Hymenobacter sp. BRD67]